MQFVHSKFFFASFRDGIRGDRSAMNQPVEHKHCAA